MISKAQVMAITAGDSWLEKGRTCFLPARQGGWSKSGSMHDGFDARIHNACDGSSPRGFLRRFNRKLGARCGSAIARRRSALRWVASRARACRTDLLCR